MPRPLVEKIEYTPEALLAASAYLLGIYCHLSGNSLAVYISQPGEKEAIQSTWITPLPPTRSIKFSASDPEVVSKLARDNLNELSTALPQFLLENCAFHSTCWIQSGDLARAFREYVGRPVSEAKTFPHLMKALMDQEEILGEDVKIEKRTTRIGVVYFGLCLRNHIQRKKNPSVQRQRSTRHH